MHRVALIAASAVALIACRRDSRGGGPAMVHTATEACHRFESAGLAHTCREVAIEPALTPGARRVVFKLPSGKYGQVFSFNDPDDYRTAATSIEDLDSGGRHHWGNKASRIYVQLNRDVADDEAARIKDLLESF